MPELQELIDRLHAFAEEIEQEVEKQDAITVGDIAIYGDNQQVRIEAVEGEMATIRIMERDEDGGLVASDEVMEVTLDELTPRNTDQDDDQSNQDDDELEEDEKSLVKGSFVSWESQDGVVIGQVYKVNTSVELPGIEEEFVSDDDSNPYVVIEVLQKRDNYERTGVFVAHQKNDISLIDEVEVEKPRILAKFKEMSLSQKIDDEDKDKKIGLIEGQASVFGEVDLGGDTVWRGAYKQTINHNGGIFQLMFDHGWKFSDTGGVTKAEEDDNGLQMTGMMPLHVPHIKSLYDMIKFMVDNGKPPGLSIGYDPIKSEPGPHGTRVLKEIALHEISITPYPMDLHARIRGAKSRKNLYNTKRSKWQTLKKATKTESDALPGNQQSDQGDIVSLVDMLNQIKQSIKS